MGLFNKKEKKEKASTKEEVKSVVLSKETKPKKSKSTLKIKNDTSKMASFWVVDIKDGAETMLFSGTISECRDYLYLASKSLIL
jgi:hypothetical protein